MKNDSVMFIPKKNMPIDQFQAKVDDITWWLKISFSNGVVTKGQTSIDEILPYFGIPLDLREKRVLDIGCSDGYFSFLAEQRGAQVVAIDAVPTRGFQFMHDVLESNVTFHRMSVYDITPQELGMFDIVFFFGVFYHLKHPTLAMEKVASITKDLVIAESAVLTEDWIKNLNISKLYEHDRPGDDMTQYWLSTTNNFIQNLRIGGFPKVKLYSEYSHPQRGNRAVIHGYKTKKTSEKFLSDSIIIRIDQPRPSALLSRGNFKIVGWVIDFKFPKDNTIEDMEVYLDDFNEENRLDGKAIFNLERPDVSKYLDVSNQTGYQFTGTLPDIKSGDHRFIVCVYTKSYWNYFTTSIKI